MVNGRSSRTQRVDCSVPQGSCLGFVEFINSSTWSRRWPLALQPSAAVRDLGVLLNQELSMPQRSAKVTSSRFYQLRRLRQIRRPVGQLLVAQLVHSFVLSRLNHGNSVLAGLPKSAIMPLQRFRNAAARLILDLRMNEHVTPALRHWLLVDRRVDFKLCTMMYSIHTGQCPTYSSDMVRADAVNQMRSGLRFADTAQYIKPRCRTYRSASVRSHTPVLSPGTIFHRH